MVLCSHCATLNLFHDLGVFCDFYYNLCTAKQLHLCRRLKLSAQADTVVNTVSASGVFIMQRIPQSLTALGVQQIPYFMHEITQCYHRVMHANHSLNAGDFYHKFTPFSTQSIFHIRSVNLGYPGFECLPDPRRPRGIQTTFQSLLCRSFELVSQRSSPVSLMALTLSLVPGGFNSLSHLMSSQHSALYSTLQIS